MTLSGLDEYSHVLVDTAWLADHLNEPKVRIIEVAYDPDRRTSGHIPNAVVWNPWVDLLLPDERVNIDGASVASLLSCSGIDRDTTIVLYGTATNVMALLPFWLLKAFGHPNVRVLDGGREKWVAEGRPVTTEMPAILPTRYEAPGAGLD